MMATNKFKILKKNGLIEFLKDGEAFLGFKTQDKVTQIFELVGQPELIIGNEEMGFYEYKNGIRIGYVDDFMDEFAILFSEKRHIEFPIHSSSLKGIKKITKNLQIFELISILNSNKIKWKSCDEKSSSCFTIITEGDVLILFDLENGELFRVVYSAISKGISQTIQW